MTYGKDSVFSRLLGDVDLGGIFSDGVRDLHIFSSSLDLVEKTVPAVQGLNEQVKLMTKAAELARLRFIVLTTILLLLLYGKWSSTTLARSDLKHVDTPASVDDHYHVAILLPCLAR
jgi:hypothetical protein